MVLVDRYAYSELLQGYMRTTSETAVRWPVATSWEWAWAEYNEKTGIYAYTQEQHTGCSAGNHGGCNG